MTPERLEQIIAAYGAASERWPAEERAAAQALLAERGECPSLREQRSLDGMLGMHAVPRPDAAMIGKALAGFTRSQGSLLGRWWVGALLAGAGALGMATGALALSLLSPRALDRSTASWIDDQPTIFSPIEIEETLL